MGDENPRRLKEGFVCDETAPPPSQRMAPLRPDRLDSHMAIQKRIRLIMPVTGRAAVQLKFNRFIEGTRDADALDHRYPPSAFAEGIMAEHCM